MKDARQKKENLKNFFKKAPIIISGILILLFLFDIGFDQNELFETIFDYAYISLIVFFVILIIGRYLIFPPRRQRIRLWVIDFLLLLLIILILSGVPFLGYFEHPIFLYLIFFIIFIRELTTVGIGESRRQINPALLFVSSFILLIIMGTLLLLLPNATVSGITITQALFTATSAVCVTGLIVVDTGSFFTPIGQTIILFLIQLGGLGVMTFTSFFSYFFKGTTSFQDQLMMRDFTNSEKVTEVYSAIKTIFGVTFLIEGIGALLIYFSIEQLDFDWSLTSIFFAVFHSISAFCNAGFSTLGDSLFEQEFRFNYSFQLVVVFLFIIGGLGFPIVFNLLKYVKHKFRLLILRKKEYYRRAWVININSKIILVTTFSLLVAGTILFYLFEYNNTLAEHSSWGKIVTAFFGAATPRTAGFNSVDMAALNFSTIMIIFLLMWIGASPGSTGGGIKTTTYAIATLNFLSLAKGKERIEVFRREISSLSVRRAFAAISLSLIVIGVAVFLLAIFDKDKRLLDIAFECFSAYSTVGLSLGITSSLSIPSQYVIIFTMFIGRVSMLTILVAFFRKINTFYYKYPTEDILIN